MQRARLPLAGRRRPMTCPESSLCSVTAMATGSSKKRTPSMLLLLCFSLALLARCCHWPRGGAIDFSLAFTGLSGGHAFAGSECPCS